MKKPIYIYVTPFFPSPDSWRGGFCYDFVKALQRLDKYDIKVFTHCRLDQSHCYDYDYHDIKVYRFKYHRGPCGIAPFLFCKWNTNSFLNKVASEGIDWKEVVVYHAHDILFSPYVENIKCKFPNILSILHFHSMGHPFQLSCGNLGVIPIYSTFQYLWYKKHFEQIDLPVFVSKRQKEMFGRWYPNGFLKEPVDIRKGVWGSNWLKPITLKPSYICYNGIDYSVFTKQDSQNSKNKIKDSLVIGDVANFAESKDQMTLIRAVERLSKDNELKGNLKCILVGSGETLAYCQHYVSEHGLGTIVEFKTEMDHLKLPEFYRSLDLFVSPSWAEGFGCTFIEAHGCGIPIMGCNGVSVDECFSKEEQEKWLFPPKDDETLARKIKWFYKTRSKQTFIDKFDIDSLVEAFVKQIEEMNKNMRVII